MNPSPNTITWGCVHLDITYTYTRSCIDGVLKVREKFYYTLFI